MVVDEKGGFFPNWKKDKERFMFPCSEEVKRWLRRLKQDNKKVFLMSSSRIDFAEASMDFVLGLVGSFARLASSVETMILFLYPKLLKTIM